MIRFGESGLFENREVALEKLLPFAPKRIGSRDAGLSLPAVQCVQRPRTHTGLATKHCDGASMQGQGKLIQLLLPVHCVDY